MANFIVLVLDGFGIGFQPDVAEVRPEDLGANTLKHLLEHQPFLRLPELERLGLMNAAGFESASMKFSAEATFGKSMLTHFGADTFWGHQEIMGTLPRRSKVEPITQSVEKLRLALEKVGYQVRMVHGNDTRFLVVDNAMTVADNIESDPGLAINITAALDAIPFDRVVAVGRIVRDLVSVSRVIAFGGSGVSIDQILAATEERGNGYVGISAPRSGVYEKNYQCVHLGYGVDSQVQLPGILGQINIPSILIGKVADIVQNPIPSNSHPMVPTKEVMLTLIEQIQMNDTAFICANVQETDLSGHRQDPEAYIDVLKEVDSHLGELQSALKINDILVIMADHGNDTAIGHSHHTREMVPLLFSGAVKRGVHVGIRSTLSDVAATAASFFKAPMPENGISFLDELQDLVAHNPLSESLFQRLDLMHQNGVLSHIEKLKVSQLIEYFYKNFEMVLEEKTAAPFVTHFAMLLYRLRRGEAILPIDDEIYSSLAAEVNFPLAARVKDQIRSEIAYFPPEEDGYILAHLINLFNSSEQYQK